MSKHDTSSALADETANLWRLGRGAELRDASLRAFKEIFGDFNGWLLYRIVHEDELEEWQQSISGQICFFSFMIVVVTLLSTIILAAVLVLHVLILHVFNMPSQKGFKKVTAPIFQALLAVGLAMVYYGLSTPGSNGPPIAIGGSMLAALSGLAILPSLIPQLARQGGGKNALAVGG